MNRRQFIKRGIIGGALLGVASAGLAYWPTKRAFDALEPLQFLSERSFQIMCAIAARIVPEAKDPRVLAHRIDQSMVTVAPEGLADMQSLLALFDNALASTLLDAQPRPFTSLGSEAQDAVLESWRDSRILLRRGGYQALRRLSVAMHYVDLEAQKAMGYMGPHRVPGLSYEDTMAGVKA